MRGWVDGCVDGWMGACVRARREIERWREREGVVKVEDKEKVD